MWFQYLNVSRRFLLLGGQGQKGVGFTLKWVRVAVVNLGDPLSTPLFFPGYILLFG